VRRFPRVAIICACTALACAAVPSFAGASDLIKRVDWGPISDHAAAMKVQHSDWEPRAVNDKANRTVPSHSQLRKWRAKSEMPYAQYVDGHYKGTTDEIIQWAAHKWGIDPDLMRADAAVESWWHQDAVGDNGDSFGLFQVRRPYHCFGKCRIARSSTAFNADYYGGIVRSYFDGTQTWLNTVGGNGATYRAGDLWGSVGAWYSGRWRDAGALGYVQHVKQDLGQRVWETADFQNG
jgi:hypothetical protein